MHIDEDHLARARSRSDQIRPLAAHALRSETVFRLFAMARVPKISAECMQITEGKHANAATMRDRVAALHRCELFDGEDVEFRGF